MKTILVAGSKKLEPPQDKKREFAEKLGEAIVKEPGWRLLTGGAKGGERDTALGGIDFHAAFGAQKSLKDEHLEKEKIITLLPREKRSDLFRIGSVVLGRAKSTRARRFELISRANAAVIIEGHEGSEQIIEYSIASDTFVIPVACYGGASREALKKEQYRDLILHNLRLNQNSPQLQMLENGGDTPDALVNTCIDILKQILRPSIFVLMPFNLSHSTELWNKMIKPTIETVGLIPQRADVVHNIGPILDDIVNCLKEAKVVIADITGTNPNVMYELGYAHAIGKPTIIICCDEGVEKLDEKVPFDIRGMRVMAFNRFDKKGFKEKLSCKIKTILGSNW